ncbi:MAG: NADH-quinone oxidoreductase subunit C [Bdellovibrionota bacterium]
MKFPEVLKNDLVTKFGVEQFKFLTTPVGDHVIEVPAVATHALLQYLKEYAGFDFLMDICGVDYPARSNKRFDVVYHLFSSKDFSRVRIKAQIAEDESIATATDIWIGADWFEREAFDMFGIIFKGHPNLRKILTHHEFSGFQLRKYF